MSRVHAKPSSSMFLCYEWNLLLFNASTKMTNVRDECDFFMFQKMTTTNEWWFSQQSVIKEGTVLEHYFDQ